MKLQFLVLILFFSILSGCYKRDFDDLRLANAQPTLLYPLIDASLTLKDMVDPVKSKLNVLEDGDGFYTFVYYEDVYQQYVRDVLRISTINQSDVIRLTTGEVAGLPGNVTLNKTVSGTIVLPLTNGAELNEVLVKSAQLTLNLQSTFRHNIRATINFPTVQLNGVPLSRTIDLNFTGTVPINRTVTVDLANYLLDLTNGGASFNRIPYSISFRINYISGNAISTAQQLTVNSSLSAIQYQYAEGYIGSYNLSIPRDSVNIDIFDNAFAGNIFFEDPKVRVVIFNSIGAPARVRIPSLTAISSITGPVAITGTPINTNIPIAFPSLSNVGQVETTTIQLDKTNSNVQTVFNPAPRLVIYELVGAVNPTGKSVNHVTDTSSIRVRAEAEIPMEGRITNFVLLDTITGITYPDLTLEQGKVTLKEVVANFQVTNGFPMRSFTQMYFITDNGTIVDSLFSAGPIEVPEPTLNASGRVVAPIVSLTQETMSQARYETIATTTRAVVVSRFRTPNNGATAIKIYSDYRFQTRLGTKVTADVAF